MDRRERAMHLFLEGYNCSQSVVLAYADLLEMDAETLAKSTSSFGGGMGRLREVCGAVSGMFMVAGFLYGYSDPGDYAAKSEHYARIQELASLFEQKNGSIVCRELLGLDHKRDQSEPSKRSGEYYRKRPCAQLVGDAAQIFEEYVRDHSSKD